MPGEVRPTKKQYELLNFIDTFIKEQGYSPSYREIMNGCQYNSVATVALHVTNLIKRGHLRKRDHSARSLEVVKDGATIMGGIGGNDDGDDANQAHRQWLSEHVRQLCGQDSPPQHIEQVGQALRTLGFDSLADELANGRHA